MPDVRHRNESAWLLPNDGSRTNHRLRADMRRFADTDEIDLVIVGCGAGGSVLLQRLARAGWRVYEVGISYDGRDYAQGKKISWRDGVRAFYVILKYNLFRRETYVCRAARIESEPTLAPDAIVRNPARCHGIVAIAVGGPPTAFDQWK